MAPAWLHKQRAGDVVYFTFASPARIERYDMAQGKWLSAITLSNTPTAFAVDASGMSIAYGRAVYTRTVDGENETALFNSAQDVRALLHAPGFIVVASINSSTSYLSTIRRSDRQFVATWSAIYGPSLGYGIDPVNRRVFGLCGFHSGADTMSVTFNADGTWPSGYPGYNTAGNYSYTSVHEPRSFVSPDGATLVLGAGYVLDAASLSYRGSLAGVVADLAFVGDDTSVVLRDSRLVAYGNSLLESGSITLAKAAAGIAVSEGQVFAFSADATKTSGIAVEKVALASFSTATPGAPLDPTTFDFIPDKVIAAGDDTFFLHSKAHQSVFRWSAGERGFLPSLRTLGSASHLAYSATDDRLYAGYSTGEIRKIDLADETPVEKPFVNLPSAVLGLQTAGSHVFTVDDSGAWETFSTFDSSGAKKSSVEWSDYSREYVWSPVQGRMYHFRDGTSPNDLEYVSIGANGMLGQKGETPYHGDYTITGPIRLSSDQTGVLIGSGVIFSATSMQYVGSLANAVTDAVSINGRWHSIRLSGTQTQLQVWSQNLLFERGLTVPGYPFRVLALNDGRLLVLTSTGGPLTDSYYNTITNTGRLIFSVVDLAGEGTVRTSPYIVSQPVSGSIYRGRPATLSVTVGGEGPFTYQWYKNGEPIAGERSASYQISSVADSHAGTYTMRVSGEFGSLTSAPASLTVLAPLAAPVITTQPVSREIGSSTSYVNLWVAATGSQLTYQWYKDGEPMSGQTSSSLYLYSITAASYGDYHVVVSNPGNSVRSATASITPPRVPTITTQPVSRYALPGQTASFGVVATSIDLTYQWRRDETPVGSSSSTLSFTVAEGDFGSYDVVVSNVSGSATSEKAELRRAVPASIVVQPVAATVYPTGDAVFSVEAAGVPATFTYRWQRYSAVSDTWVNVVGDTFYYSGVTTARLVVTNATASMNGLVFRCVVGNGYGVSAVSDGVALVVDADLRPPLRFTVQPVGRTVVAGQSVYFSVNTNALVPPSYQWYLDGVAIPGATSSVLPITPVGVNDGGNYTVLAQNASGAVMSEPAVLVVASPARPFIEADRSNIDADVGQPVVLAVAFAGDPLPTLVWRKNGKVIAGVSGDSLAFEAVKLADAGLYRVTATNANGSASVDIRLGVRPPEPLAPVLGVLHQGERVDLSLAVETAVVGLRYRSTGLPKGLALDPVTGRLSGLVNDKAGSYALKFWNELSGAKSDILSRGVEVVAFPAAFTGSFEGMLRVAEGYQLLPAGFVAIKVGPTGSFTGTLRTATDKNTIPLRGRFAPAPGGESATVTLVVSGGRELALFFDSAADVVLRGRYRRPGAAEAVMDLGVRLRTTPVEQAAVGPYTIGLGPVRSALDVAPTTIWPGGLGHAAAMLAANGTLSVTGRLGDGTPFTAKLNAPDFYDPEWGYYYQLFLRPHAQGENYFGGWFLLSPEEADASRPHRVASYEGEQEFFWKKSAQTKDEPYRDGFEPLALDWRMQRWVSPSRTTGTLATLLEAEGLNIAMIEAGRDSRLPFMDQSLSPRFDLRLDPKTPRFLPIVEAPTASSRAWSAAVVLRSGQLKGRMLVPVEADENGGVTRSVPATFDGVLFQPQEGAYGERAMFTYVVRLPGGPLITGSFYLLFYE